MSKPIIGITVDAKRNDADERSGGDLKLNWNYADAIAKAGGVPILIPPQADMEQVAQIIDGWVIPGGNDIDARHFGEQNHPSVKLIDAARFEGEAALYRAANPKMPVLGICYGCQFVNVMRGGSLVQHLPDELGHDNHTGGTLQSYAFSPDSKTSEVVGSADIEGKSYHHQAIRSVGDGLRVVAHSEDGVVEAIEDASHPWFIGVQWHPERTQADEKTQRLFASFVRAAKEFRESRMALGMGR